jgi:hypothetical protein
MIRQVGRHCAFEDQCHTERDDTSADYRPRGYLMARRERRKPDAAADSHMDA